MVRRTCCSVLEPDGNAHRPGENLDSPSCQLVAKGAWHPRLSLRREEWRMADNERCGEIAWRATMRSVGSSRTESLPQSKSSPTLRIKYAPAIYKTKKSSTRSPEILARVASKWKTSLQCFQTLEKGVHNESLIAIGRRERSTVVLSSSMRPSSMKRVRPSHRDRA